jgi:cell division protein FtsA
LEVKVHIVTGAVSAAQNIVKCVRRCGLEVNDLILQPLASSLAVLTEDEKELGVVLIDIGGGTTDIAIYSQGSIRHTAVIPIAGDQITNDIAMALRTPTIEAEDLKIHHGVARQELSDATAMIDVPGVGDREPRPMSKQALAAVIEPRVEELFTLVRNIVRESGYEDMVSSGIVLTGGTAMMPGMEELAEHVFLKPARIGSPEYRGHLHEVLRSPRYSTGLGLLMEGQAQLMRGRRSLQSGSFQGVVSRMKEWFTGNF